MSGRPGTRRDRALLTWAAGLGLLGFSLVVVFTKTPAGQVPRLPWVAVLAGLNLVFVAMVLASVALVSILGGPR